MIYNSISYFLKKYEMENQASINGLTFIKESPCRSYHGTLNLKNISKYRILSKIKKWICEHKDFNRTFSLTISDSINFSNCINDNDNDPEDSIIIQGFVLNDKNNDNTIFDLLYNFFQYLFIESEQKVLYWSFKTFEKNTMYEITHTNIKPVKK